MSKKYPEYPSLDLTAVAADILCRWEEENTFEASVALREGRPSFTFYEGPPSANGLPGIHHVMARAIKDIFCRYKTQKGFQVKRKGGWDTHGLPIELSVEKTLGIRKDDIGKTISIEDYNKACRKEVMKYKDVWDDLTKKMGYWVDLEHPYITFENSYIESCWHLLSRLYKKGLLYKGFTIQPYSPAAGTGLSSHELNQPGTYKSVKDTTVVAMFPFKGDIGITDLPVYFLAWTTTPWTLPSNTALAVGAKINYVAVESFNPYTGDRIVVILAKDLMGNFFSEKNAALSMDEYKSGDKAIPFRVVKSFTGQELTGLRYEQLLPYAQPTDGDAFRVIAGDFVSTEDGTGIVHIAPSFGSDDFRVAKQNGIGSLTLVDRQGKFTEEVTDMAGEFVKEQYLTDDEKAISKNKQGGEKYLTVDERIAIKLKKEGKAFKVEKYEHNYPHCWRTDKPVLYYPLDSWFIRTTALKDRMVELNKTINWKPESTGTGRFGNWLENLVDWNLSRSRYWGIPLPVWRTEDGSEEICIGSVKELNDAINDSVRAGFMKSNPLKGNIDTTSKDFLYDLHRPYVDDIILVSPGGKKMQRETDLIDVWFDSGAMPYAQWHYMGEDNQLPFTQKQDNAFPADFIAEGVDQTRGWFFTLHAIAVMLFDGVAFKNVVSNGLVLDKNGNKMSKRLGNAVDPFETLSKYGPDATRWYMISNAQPWDNLKFNQDGITEVQRKFFGTLFNTYSFFSLYANIDGFSFKEKEVAVSQRPELDRWILSTLNSLIQTVDESYADYEPTRAARAIADFVSEHLSNWYVRLGRRRFWKGEYSEDKIAAYQTLYTCLETIARLMAPIAPFYADQLFRSLNEVSGFRTVNSVHLTDFPEGDASLIDKALEERMHLAQQVSSLVLSLRKKVNIRVRQPLNKILLPVIDSGFQENIEAIKHLILAEVNVKEIEYITDTAGILIKKIKPNFKVLGKKVGGLMKDCAAGITAMSQDDILVLEQTGTFQLNVNGNMIAVVAEDVEILSEDIPGWQVASEGRLTVALDVTLTDQLKEEGLAREFINRMQNLRKENGFEVTDRIDIQLVGHEMACAAIVHNKAYICAEILAESLEIVDRLDSTESVEVEVDDSIQLSVLIKKHS